MTLPRDLRVADTERLASVLYAAAPNRYEQLLPGCGAWSSHVVRQKLLEELRRLPASTWRDWKS
jgi:hypothetical protein